MKTEILNHINIILPSIIALSPPAIRTLLETEPPTLEIENREKNNEFIITVTFENQDESFQILVKISSELRINFLKVNLKDLSKFVSQNKDSIGMLLITDNIENFARVLRKNLELVPERAVPRAYWNRIYIVTNPKNANIESESLERILLPAFVSQNNDIE